MKNLVFLIIIGIITLHFTFNLNGNENNTASNSITICVDSTCSEVKLACNLYNSSHVNVGTCEINQLYTACCTVDSVPYPAWYYWQVVSRTQTCNGSLFYYNGGQTTITFSCDSCN